MNPEIRLAGKIPLLLSSSIRSLLDVTNAISIPEKKADSKSVIPTINQLFIKRNQYWQEDKVIKLGWILLVMEDFTCKLSDNEGL